MCWGGTGSLTLSAVIQLGMKSGAPALAVLPKAADNHQCLRGISCLFILCLFLSPLCEFSLVFSRAIYKIQIPIDSQGEGTLMYSHVRPCSPPHGKERFIGFSVCAAALQSSQQSSHTKLNTDIFLLLACSRMLCQAALGKAHPSLRSGKAKFIWTRRKLVPREQLEPFQLCAFRVFEVGTSAPGRIQRCAAAQNMEQGIGIGNWEGPWSSPSPNPTNQMCTELCVMGV